MGNKGWFGLAVGVIAALVGLGVWYWPARESPQLTEVKQLQAQMQQKMFAPAATQGSASPEEHRAMRQQLEEKMEALPEAERKQAEQSMHEGFQRQMQEKFTIFFALSPAEQTAALDKEIDEQEARMKAFGGMPFGPRGGPRSQPEGKQSGGNPANPPAAPGGSAPPGGSAAPGGSPPPGPGGPPGHRPFGPRGNPQNMTSDQRKDFHRNILDSTTPEFRAQMSEYIKKLQQRRQERGLPSFGPRT